LFESTGDGHLTVAETTAIQNDKFNARMVHQGRDHKDEFSPELKQGKYDFERPYTEGERQLLWDAIRRHPLPTPVYADHAGYILDGHEVYPLFRRLQTELRDRYPAFDFPVYEIDVSEWTDDRIRWLVRTLNVNRRHFQSARERKAAVKEYIKLDPWVSGRALAAKCGVDRTTIDDYRTEMVAGGEIPPPERITGRDGKCYRPVPGSQIARYLTVRSAIEQQPDKYKDLERLLAKPNRPVGIKSAFNAYEKRLQLSCVEVDRPSQGNISFGDKVLCGDCREMLPRLPSRAFDAIITDPVFGLGFDYRGGKEPIDRDPDAYWAFLGPIYDEFVRLLKPGGFLALCLARAYEDHFKQWFGADVHKFIHCHQNLSLACLRPITYAWSPVVTKYVPGAPPLTPRRRPDEASISLDWHVSNDNNLRELRQHHPCPLSYDLCERLVKSYVIENGVVLDPFCGTGQVPLACKRNGRHYCGIEIDEEYCRFAQDRLSKG
jgi:site-specific DNA-methyltransferase (adenine-specific)